MRRLIVIAAALALAAVSVACTSIEKRAEQISSQGFARYATGRPYAEVAALADFQADTLGRVKTYGEPIGSYALPNGDIVHRHVRSEPRSSSSVDFGLLRQSETVNYAQRLSYFRVGPDGIVRDVASGFVPGDRERCIGYAGGLVTRCEDMQALNQTLIEYDHVVRTRTGEPLSSWGAPVTET